MERNSPKCVVWLGAYIQGPSWSGLFLCLSNTGMRWDTVSLRCHQRIMQHLRQSGAIQAPTGA